MGGGFGDAVGFDDGGGGGVPVDGCAERAEGIGGGDASRGCRQASGIRGMSVMAEEE